MTLYLLVLYYSSETSSSETLYYSSLFRSELKAIRIAEELQSDDSSLLSYEIISLDYSG